MRKIPRLNPYEETSQLSQFTKRKFMRLKWNSALGAIVLAAVAFTPKALLAQPGLPVEGTFAVSIAVPSASDFCTSEGTPSGTSIEAQGIGSASRLGPLFLKITKCVTFPDGNVGTYAGTFEMTAANGDKLNGTYAGTQDFSLLDANDFGPFQGTLTVTGGTGAFNHASGALGFTAISSASLKDSAANGQAYYLIKGTIRE
jgi:hypothetical protein